MKINATSFFFFLFSISTSAQKISGKVTGIFGEAQSFASIIVKGTSIGVAANDSGTYIIHLNPGTYTLQCAHLGYETAEKLVTITSHDVVVDFKMESVQYHLREVVVHSGGEDPAYEIIRNAIKLRSEHESELKKFECEVYIKGNLQLRNYPKKFLGNDVDFEDGDTSKKKIIFLSETIARYSVQQPDSKVEVISTKVSGNSDGFGFGAPQIISFYKNDVQIGRNLSPRGFISPIADNALDYYKYKFEGSFFDNGKMIDRIRVTPKRKFEPLFSGIINIIEDEWRIYSVQLTLLKEQQLQLLDTLKIEQLYVPANGILLIKQQNIYPAIKFFGFDAFGSFVQVYDKFNMQPDFAKNFFGNTFLKYDDSSNKKPLAYWDSIRPIPLQTMESLDYIKKDSLEKLRNTAHYMDSIDRKENKFKPLNLFLLGQTFSHTLEKSSLAFEPLFDEINYNTVEGIVYNFSPTFNKIFKNKQELTLTPTLRYGFSDQLFTAHLAGEYKFDKKKKESLFFAGGKKVMQFNPDGNITPRFNSLLTLFNGLNYMKIYETNFADIGYSKSFNNGFSLTFSSKYEYRLPLENTTLYSAAKAADISFTPNYPVELADMNMQPNHALTTTVDLNWKPGTRYIEFPDRKINIGSKYPTFNLHFTQGINGVLGSNVDYSKWQLGISQSINMHIAGRFMYNINLGGFLNSSKIFLPDFQQFLGNQVVTSADYLKGFQLMNYYQYSTIAPFYTEAYVEYHLNGLLSNKIPVFQKLNWFFVIGSNALYTTDSKQYTEIFFSIENIFRICRIDFVQAFGQNCYNTSGIRFSVTGVVNSHKEN